MSIVDGPWDSCVFVKGLNVSECASWVQAWGSIGAILVAAGVFWSGRWFQERDRRRNAESDYTRLLEFAYEVLKGALDVARKIHSYESIVGAGPATRRAMLAEARTYANAFTQIQVGQLRTATLLRAVLAGSTLCQKLVDDIEFTLRPERQEGPQFDLTVQEIVEALEPNEETLRMALLDRRTPLRGGKK